MKKIRLIIALMLSALLAATAWAAEKTSYNYIGAVELETRLKANESIFLLDIQVPEEFGRHHIKGAVPTHAYPVQSDADKARIDAVLEKVKGSSAPVVVVCPRGAGGATRTVDYLVAKGIDPRRLFILEKGQSGWTCAELTEAQ